MSLSQQSDRPSPKRRKVVVTEAAVPVEEVERSLVNPLMTILHDFSTIMDIRSQQRNHVATVGFDEGDESEAQSEDDEYRFFESFIPKQSSDHEKEKGVYGFTFDDFWKEDEEQRAKLLHVFRQRVEEMKQRKMKKTAPPLIRANSSNSDGQESNDSQKDGRGDEGLEDRECGFSETMHSQAQSQSNGFGG